MTILIICLVIWDIYWKFYALWHAARNSHKEWFLAILIIGSVGILPIYYLYRQGFFKK